MREFPGTVNYCFYVRLTACPTLCFFCCSRVQICNTSHYVIRLKSIFFFIQASKLQVWQSTMASILKAQTAIASKMEGRRKRKADDMEVDEENGIVPTKKPKNKQRVLMLSSRGVTHRMRHLMNDLEALFPHVKKGAFSCQPFRTTVDSNMSLDSKLDSKSQLHLLPELADLHNCNNTLYFEARRHEDLYMWAAKTPNGPSIKMHVQNIHTMDELKMTGNCLKGSRGLLSFDRAFEETEWGKLTKEVFTHVRCLLQYEKQNVLISIVHRYLVSHLRRGKRNLSSITFLLSRFWIRRYGFVIFRLAVITSINQTCDHCSSR